MKKRKIIGLPNRPRLSVFRSLRNIHAQIIDDFSGKTLVAASSLKMKSSANVAAAREVGAKIAQQAKAQGITKVVFDRGKARYHGRIKALADAARQGGLIF